MAPSSVSTTCAALCTLTVSASLLEKDVVLQLVLHLASDKQVAVVVRQVKKGGSKDDSKESQSLALLLSGGTVLEQRAAILRALAGPALHYALDNVLLGSHGAAAAHAGSLASILSMASLESYMGVAAAHRQQQQQLQPSSSSSPSTALLEQLEKTLQTSSFLIPSSRATLADFEMGAALFKSADPADVDAANKNFPSVMRWWTTVRAQMVALGGGAVKGLEEMSPEATPQPIPTFYYGTEEAVVASKPSGANASSSTTNNNNDTAAAAKGESGKKAAVAAVAADPPAAAAGGLTDEQKKAAADKRAKKAAEKAKKKPAPPPAAAATDLDISALDIRVGKIIKAWHHAEAEKLFCEEIDVGEDEPRQIASGLRLFYETKDLEGRLVLVLCNLKSRSLVGFPSHGMVLCASNADHTAVEFVVPPPGAVPGERVAFGGLAAGEPEQENKVAKKKLAEKLLPDLKTAPDGTVVWKTHPATTAKGPVRALNGMANAHVG